MTSAENVVAEAAFATGPRKLPMRWLGPFAVAIALLSALVTFVVLAGLTAITPTHEVVERMAREGIRRMVVTQKGRVVGMITSKDVINAFKPYIDRLSADISGFQPSLT